MLEVDLRARSCSSTTVIPGSPSTSGAEVDVGEVALSQSNEARRQISRPSGQQEEEPRGANGSSVPA